MNGIDANILVTGNQNFKYIGQQTFHRQAGELRFKFEGSAKTIVEGDVNGDGVADFQVQLSGHVGLTRGALFCSILDKTIAAPVELALSAEYRSVSCSKLELALAA